MYKIKQSRTVQDYIDKFCRLVDQLQAYSPHTDPIYYTTRFIDGLSDDIKFLIAVQRPKDLDTACCLALLQEETTSSLGKPYKSANIGFSQKPFFRGALPLPRPPLQQKSDNITDDKSKTVGKIHSVEDKL
jgi:hypothetical protein